MDLIIIFLSLTVFIYLINFISRYATHGNDNGVICSISFASMLLTFMAYVFVSSEYLIEVFNPPYKMDSIYTVGLLFAGLIAGAISIFVTNFLFKLKFTKFENKVINFVSNNKVLCNSIIEKVISASCIIVFFCYNLIFCIFWNNYLEFSRKDKQGNQSNIW